MNDKATLSHNNQSIIDEALLEERELISVLKEAVDHAHSILALAQKKKGFLANKSIAALRQQIPDLECSHESAVSSLEGLEVLFFSANTSLPDDLNVMKRVSIDTGVALANLKRRLNEQSPFILKSNA